MMSLRKLDKEITDLSSLYDPKFCDEVQRAIDIEAKFNEDTNNYDTPSVAFNLWSTIKYIGNLYINKCIKNICQINKLMPKIFKNYLFKKLALLSIELSLNHSYSNKAERK